MSSTPDAVIDRVVPGNESGIAAPNGLHQEAIHCLCGSDSRTIAINVPAREDWKTARTELKTHLVDMVKTGHLDKVPYGMTLSDVAEATLIAEGKQHTWKDIQKQMQIFVEINTCKKCTEFGIPGKTTPDTPFLITPDGKPIPVPDGAGVTGSGDTPNQPGVVGDGGSPKQPGMVGDGDTPNQPGMVGDGGSPKQPGMVGDGDTPNEPGKVGVVDSPNQPGMVGSGGDQPTAHATIEITNEKGEVISRGSNDPSDSERQAMTQQQLSTLDPQEFKELTPALIKSDRAAWLQVLPGLTPEQARVLNKEQVGALSEERLLGALRPQTLAALQPETLRSVTPEGLSCFSDDQIKALTKEQQNVLDDAVSNWTAADVKGMTPKVIGDLSHDYLTAIRPEAIAQMTAEQAQALKPENAAALTDEQVAAIEDKTARTIVENYQPCY